MHRWYIPGWKTWLAWRVRARPVCKTDLSPYACAFSLPFLLRLRSLAQVSFAKFLSFPPDELCASHRVPFHSGFAWRIEIATVKNRLKSIISQKTWYHSMVIAVILGGAVWPKSSFKNRFLEKLILYQCKNSTQIRLFPRSRLCQMTYRKLKPLSSWHLLHAPFNSFYHFSTKLRKHWISI